MESNFIKKKDCGVCNKKDFEKVIKLKKFPLTGIFIKKEISKNFQYYFDQSLNLCKNCGHLQLEKFVSSELLYNNIYANRTSASHLSDNAINFFKKFMFETLKNKRIKNILEVGCNDTKLIKSLKKKDHHIFGIDPIWINKKKPKNKNFTILGGFIEKINLKEKINKPINIFISTHNLEHISDPYKVLKKIIDFAEDDTTFFIEVPDADLMIKNHRFDQIFHQHYHYFSLRSLQNLTKRLGCKIIKKKINLKFWGGSLLIAFKKEKKIKEIKLKNNYFHYKKKIKTNYPKFEDHNRRLKQKLMNEKTLIGYGAGQMVPSFAYHLKSDLSFLDYIVDDNSNRSDQKYPNLKPKVKLSQEKFISKKKFLITALDGVQAISNKLKKKKLSFINPLFK